LITTLNRIWERLRGGHAGETPEVLAALFGDGTDALTLRLADTLAPSGRVRALRLVDVPRDKPLPTEEESETLAGAERKRLGRLAGKLQIEPARSPCACLLEQTARVGAPLLVLSSPLPTDDAREALLGRLLRESPCETLLARVPAGISPELAHSTTLLVALTREAPLAPSLLHRLARLSHSGVRVRLVGFLEVPRSLPTDASLPEEEAALEALLHETSTALGIKTESCIKKVRQLSEELIRASSGERQVLLLSSELLSAAPELLTRASCLLLIGRSTQS
jgi:hypothetical protein